MGVCVCVGPSTDMGRPAFLLCFCLLAALAAGEKTYHGYTVLRTEKLDATTSQMVFNELAEVEGLSFWKDPAPGRQADIMAAPHMKTRLEAWLKEQGIKHAPMVADVQSLIEETRPSPKKSKSGAGNYTMDWEDYHDHTTLNEFIAALADANDWANVINIGQSYEGRDMNVLAITKAGPGAPAVATFIMRNIRDFVTTLDPVPVLGHCFHSYSQLWLWPYGYGYNAYPENKEEIQQLAIDASDALFQVHGTVFDPINSADLYPAAGASDDWYKGVLGTRFAFTTELRDTGSHGFILPKDQIIPSGEEMWAGFEVVINRILETEVVN